MTYAEKKEAIRNEAIEYQLTLEENNYSLGELIEKEAYFEKQGRRYGLLREFRENRIC